MATKPSLIAEKGIYITDDEAESLLDFIELHFIDSIRDDPDADSMIYIANIGSVYKKLCDEVFAKYDKLESEVTK
jgi:hypothetical protein